MSEKLSKEAREILARLHALAAISEAQIKANPIAHINRVSKENAELREAIKEAILALSGADDFDMAKTRFPDQPASIAETATLRNSKALNLLRASIK
ncbi:MAG: hypothetical protein RLW87_06940 [Alphaproteobacteria bacterium]